MNQWGLQNSRQGYDRKYNIKNCSTNFNEDHKSLDSGEVGGDVAHNAALCPTYTEY